MASDPALTSEAVSMLKAGQSAEAVAAMLVGRGIDAAEANAMVGQLLELKRAAEQQARDAEFLRYEAQGAATRAASAEKTKASVMAIVIGVPACLGGLVAIVMGWYSVDYAAHMQVRPGMPFDEETCRLAALGHDMPEDLLERCQQWAQASSMGKAMLVLGVAALIGGSIALVIGIRRVIRARSRAA
jgi:hypothetical protein